MHHFFGHRFWFTHLSPEQRQQVARTHQHLLVRAWQLWLSWGVIGASWAWFLFAAMRRWNHRPSILPASDDWMLSWQTLALIEMPAILLAALVIDPMSRRLYRCALLLNNLCSNCGYDLRASGARCPECGRCRDGTTPAPDQK